MQMRKMRVASNIALRHTVYKKQYNLPAGIYANIGMCTWLVGPVGATE